MIKKLIFLLFIVFMPSYCYSHDCVCTKNNKQCYCDVCNCSKNLTYEEALELAEKYDKKVFIFFGGEYCSWCKKQKAVLSNKDISNKLDEYIICYIDITKNRNLAKKYKVSSVPNCFVIDKNENILKESNGYKKEKDFLSWLD